MLFNTCSLIINVLPVDRVLGVVMDCLGEVKSEMAERCSSNDVIAQYELDLINPLVELTRSFVVAECMMSEKDKQLYFSVTDDVTYRTASVAVICSSFVALAVARWLVLSGLQ